MMISVCIPVYNTEKVLERCLESIAKQDFDSFEIVLVNDCSPGKNEKNWSCSKIIKKFKKTTKIPVNYIENGHNLGILEVRRTLACEAKGDYIFYLDSDDILKPDALSILYNEAIKNDADIVHGTLISGSYKDGEFTKSKTQRSSKTYVGKLTGHDIFTKTYVERQDAMIVCAKLIKTSLLLKVFEIIPYAVISMSQDYLISFFLNYYAQTFVGIENIIYLYINTEGITSEKKVSSIEECCKISSVASVFAIIKNWIEENPGKLKEEEIKRIDDDALLQFKTNYNHLDALCEPDLKPKAMKVIRAYWGDEVVNSFENSLNQIQK